MRDLSARHTAWESLSPRDQFYWTTVYYNSGAGAGHDLLEKHGVGIASQPWTRGDDYGHYGSNPMFNATWRTATWELVSRGKAGTALDFPQPSTLTMPRSQLAATAQRLIDERLRPIMRGEMAISAFEELRQFWMQLDPNDAALQAQVPELSVAASYVSIVEGMVSRLIGLEQPMFAPLIKRVFALLGDAPPAWSSLTLPAAVLSIGRTKGVVEANPKSFNTREQFVLSQRLTELDQLAGGAGGLAKRPAEKQDALLGAQHRVEAFVHGQDVMSSVQAQVDYTLAVDLAGR